MSLYRCAACGSQNVIEDDINSGVKYNLVKGTVGAYFFGVPGAMAGLGNQQSKVYICKDCGIQLTYPMDSELKMLIDTGLIGSENRKYLNYNGFHIDWNSLKRTYKNIEDSSSDVLGNNASSWSLQSRNYDCINQKDFDSALSIIKKYQNLTEGSNNISAVSPIGLKDYISIQSAIDTVAENYTRFIPSRYNRSAEYNGFKMDKFASSFLISYATTHYYSESGKLLSTYSTNKNGELALYLNSHSYVFDCIKRYENEFGQKHVEDDGFVNWIPLSSWWTNSEHFMYKSFHMFMNDKESLLYNPNCAPNVAGKDRSGNAFLVHVPDYKVINGLLCYAKWTYPNEWWKTVKANRDFNGSYQAILSEYFATYPEKIDDYNKTVEDFFLKKEINEDAKKKTWDDISSKKAQISALEIRRDALKSDIDSCNQEITRLKNKIFGKAKAEQQIQMLTARKESFVADIADLNTNITNLQVELGNAQAMHSYLYTEKYDGFDGFSDFFYSLLNKFDCFGVWMPVDESKCNNLLIPKTETKEEPSTTIQQNTLPLSNADEILKYKNLMDAGIITADEFEAKKKQLLGL